MATPLEPKKIKNLGVYGLIRPSEVDDDLIPDQAVTEVINMHFDRKGAAIVRPGLVNTWGTVSTASGFNPCLGLFNAQGSFLLAGFIGTGAVAKDVFVYKGVGWGRLAFGGTSSTAKIRFVDFAGRTLIMNGTQDSITMSDLLYTGNNPTGNPLNPNQFQDGGGVADRKTASFGEVYKSRIYLAGDKGDQSTSNYLGKPNRLYYSSVIDTNGNITWNPTVDYVDINPGDGEVITGLKRYSLELDIFKPNYIYRFRTAGLDPDPLIRIGTRSHESIVEGKQGLYFHHDSGFYRYTGGYPTEISRPISDIVDAIPFSQLDDVAGWRDNDHIYWSLGNVTVNEPYGAVTIKNCVVRYTESSELWTVYSYPYDIRRGATFVQASTVLGIATSMSVVVGLDNGVVAGFNSGVTDLGEPIKYRLRTKWFDFGSISETKHIQEMIAVCEKAQASQISYQIDEDYSIYTIGDLQKLVNFFDKAKIKDFRRIRFLLIGTCRFESPVFKGFEVIKGTNQGVTI